MGKTFRSLFSRFSKTELFHFYVHPTYPEVDMCNAYYRITDKEALKSAYLFCAPGREVCVDKILSLNSSSFSVKNKNSAVSRLARDIIWKLSHWYSKSLKDWLDRESPTHIFLAPGYAKFIYDIALRIAKDRGIPIVTYICDDYYFVKCPKSFLGRLQFCLLQNKIEAVMKKTVCLVAICDEITALYREKFGLPSVTIMTGSDLSFQNSKVGDSIPTSISYFGNVGCNRYVSLCEIGRALDEINQNKGTSYNLRIYTNEQDSSVLKLLADIPCIRLCDFVTGDDFRDAVLGSDLLLHTEAFDEQSVDLVKHSISTKIADSLASGIPLLAYGPERISSMKHLIRNDCALVATSRSELNSMLEMAFTQKEARIRVVENALRTAAEYHDTRKNSIKLRTIFAKKEEYLYE